jgi:gamma-tubulin complex component 5
MSSLSPTPVVASLVSLQHALNNEFTSTLSAFLAVPEELGLGKSIAQRRPPAALARQILDGLMSAAHSASLRGETHVASALFGAFVAAAEPLWSLTLSWLRDGPRPVATVGGGLVGAGAGVGGGGGGAVDPEFFVEDNELPLLDPDFWRDGLVLRTEMDGGGGERELVPVLMAGVADLVLGAGKAVALLRVLRPLASAGQDEDDDEELQQARVELDSLGFLAEVLEGYDQDVFAAGDTLSNLVHDRLAPYCRVIQADLAKIVATGCDLWYHLDALEQLFLTRRGDVADRFADAVFTRVSLLSITPYLGPDRVL